MNWHVAITRNREALISVIVALMKTLGLVDGAALTTLPFYVYRNALRIIRPAEAAVRRLIMMAAYELDLRGIVLQKSRIPSTLRTGTFPHAVHFAPSFNLIDPLKSFGPETPDYTCFRTGLDAKGRAFDKKPICAAALGRRLLALKFALGNIDKHARRLTRWYRARDLALIRMQPHRLSPLRPGFPPGYVKRPTLPIDEILRDCHSLSQCARERRDSP